MVRKLDVGNLPYTVTESALSERIAGDHPSASRRVSARV